MIRFRIDRDSPQDDPGPLTFCIEQQTGRASPMQRSYAETLRLTGLKLGRTENSKVTATTAFSSADKNGTGIITISAKASDLLSLSFWLLCWIHEVDKRKLSLPSLDDVILIGVFANRHGQPNSPYRRHYRDHFDDLLKSSGFKASLDDTESGLVVKPENWESAAICLYLADTALVVKAAHNPNQFFTLPRDIIDFYRSFGCHHKVATHKPS